MSICLNNLKLTSKEDTNIIGANVNAYETLALKVGGVLKIELVQNITKSSSQTIGANAGVSGLKRGRWKRYYKN